MLAPALAPMAAFRQFILCKLAPGSRPGKLTKLPCDWRTGAVANAHDDAVQTDWITAFAAAEQRGDGWGVGFVLTERDPFWFLDIDECLTPTGWSELATSMCAALPGVAVEVSHSGRGLHLFGTGVVPPHGCRNDQHHLEFYTSERFVFLGRQETAAGNAGQDCTGTIGRIVAQWFAPTEAAQAGLEWTDTPCDEWHGPSDDTELLRRALASKGARSTFGSGASFADLFDANEVALAKAFPDAGGRSYNASSADAALAAHLAFWTGRDCARIERLMRMSKLARDKWDQRDDYLTSRTIINACRHNRDVLRDKPPEPPGTVLPALIGTSAPQAQRMTGSTFLGLDDQLTHFAGCVYVTALNQVLVPGGNTINEARFKVLYGGRTFAMDAANERTTRNAWEAFTESQVFRHPRADSVCFRPDIAPSMIVSDAGRTRVNTYWPADTPRAVGDAGPFLRHLAKLLPDEHDREIAMCYMAACVQHQGVKFQWAPLFQGVEGNGKTFLSTCVAEAIGQRYVHWPEAKVFTKQFNGWRYGKTFVAVNDIYLPGGQADVIERMKPMITDRLAAVEPKGVDEVTVEVCENYMFNCNPKNALRKTKNDRRLAVFYTAQQDAADLTRDGMAGNYFGDLYGWYRDGGMAIVNELLWSYPIPDALNPAKGLQRSPRTSSTDSAIEHGMGNVEQEVMEAIEQGRQGFAGGWVSSTYLDALLEDCGLAKALPRVRRREMLQGLGYDWHPALDKGRTDNPVMPDGGKPRLYIKAGHADLALTNRADVAKAYSRAQGAAMGLGARV